MKDCVCYYLVDVTQGSKDWLYMRKGRITMSNLGKIVGHAPYCTLSHEDLGKCFRGLLKEDFSREISEPKRKTVSLSGKLLDMVVKSDLYISRALF